jgi:hypothetical protein
MSYSGTVGTEEQRRDGERGDGEEVLKQTGTWPLMASSAEDKGTRWCTWAAAGTMCVTRSCGRGTELWLAENDAEAAVSDAHSVWALQHALGRSGRWVGWPGGLG